MKSWSDFALKTARRESQCQLCGGVIERGQKYRDGGRARRAHEECAVKTPSTELPHDIWKDPEVMAALKEGRAADDIAVLPCPRCSEYGYYNQGSHFYCRFCDAGFDVVSEGEESPRESVSADEMISLVDTVTLCEDGYHNRTVISEG